MGRQGKKGRSKIGLGEKGEVSEGVRKTGRKKKRKG